MNKNHLNQKDKYVFYYLRYAMLLGPLTILSFFISETEGNLPFAFGLVQNILFFSSVPGYFILPGVLKGVKNNKNVKYLELQLFMGFTIITLGFGPSILFFKKYEPIVKKMINGKKAT